MSKLALLGGQPVFEPLLDWKSFWPPVDEVTARKLQELYYSRKWNAFERVENEFVRDFAAYQGAKYGVFTINGTITLQCALAAYGIGPGDEVIVPPVSWFATAMAVCHVGARPVFVDVEPDTFSIDPDKIVAAITERTKAIIPVHTFGSMADMDRIMAIAKRHNLRVIEDCAHMHGGIWGGKGVGSIGDVGSFSFQWTKTLSSGEGGMCITNDPDIAERIFRIKQVGYGPGELPRQVLSPPPPGMLCYNFRATAFHPVILHQQLGSLASLLERYSKAVHYLEERLAQSTKVRFQAPGRKADRQGRWSWVMIFDDPAYVDVPIDVIQQAFHAEGLPVYPPEGPMYRYILWNVPPEAYRVDQPCVVTEHICSHSLWLLHPYLGLEMSQLERMADVVEKVVRHVDDLRAHARNR
jgi:dTDP-4-amino-4,6-dideoxygalactose transaminase